MTKKALTARQPWIILLIIFLICKTRSFIWSRIILKAVIVNFILYLICITFDNIILTNSLYKYIFLCFLILIYKPIIAFYLNGRFLDSRIHDKCKITML